MKMYHITPAIVSLEMKMATLSPKDSSISACYAINCKITEEDKNIKIVLHNKAIIEEIFVYKATMIQEEQTQECIIIDNQEKEEILLIVV